MCEHFVPKQLLGIVLLILDGHASHVNSVEMLEFANSNDITILCLPSHTTHSLQTLDRRHLNHTFNKHAVCGRRITRY